MSTFAYVNGMMSGILSVYAFRSQVCGCRTPGPTIKAFIPIWMSPVYNLWVSELSGCLPWVIVPNVPPIMHRFNAGH